MKRALLAGSVMAFTLAFSGCDEDQRRTEQKINAPAPEYATRYIMACPKCGAPQSPFRINVLKSYYTCNGLAPKFPYHPTKEWSHRITDHNPQVEK